MLECSSLQERTSRSHSPPHYDCTTLSLSCCTSFVTVDRMWEFQFSTYFPVLDIVNLLIFIHSPRCIEAFHCDFNIYFSDEWWPFGCVLFWVPIQVSCSFIFLLNCVSFSSWFSRVVCIFWLKALFVVCVVKVFLHSVTCLFALIMGSLMSRND